MVYVKTLSPWDLTETGWDPTMSAPFFFMDGDGLANISCNRNNVDGSNDDGGTTEKDQQPYDAFQVFLDQLILIL